MRSRRKVAATRRAVVDEEQQELTAGKVLNRLIALIQCNMFDPQMPITDVLDSKMFKALIEEGDYKPS